MCISIINLVGTMYLIFWWYKTVDFVCNINFLFFQVLKNLQTYLVEEELQMAKSDAECKYHNFCVKLIFQN